MAGMKAARCIFLLATVASFTAGLPFFNVGIDTQGSSGKNIGSGNVIKPVLPAQPQPPVITISKQQTIASIQDYTTGSPQSMLIANPENIGKPDGKNVPTSLAPTPVTTVIGIGPQKWIRKTPRRAFMTHPCNAAHNFRTQEFETTDRRGHKIIKCYRLSEIELLNQRNCSGTFEEKFTATSFEQARDNAHRRTQLKKKRGTRKSRAKRDASISKMERGTWQVCNCQARFTVDESTGLGMPCGMCSTIYRQNTTSRFPQYVNGAICHPNEEELVYDGSGQAIGRCVQQSFTQDLLEWTGTWEIDIARSAQLGVDVYVEQWEPYSQVIKSSCVFQFVLA